MGDNLTSSSDGIDAFAAFASLKEALLRYYDTPFGLANESLMEERRALLDKDRGLYREPLLELRAPYKTTGRSVAESAASAGLSSIEAEFLTSGLMEPGLQLYTHQEASLRSALRGRKNIVLTPGTGSGKTEAFLLPILGQLLMESRRWGGKGSSASEWWAGPGMPFSPMRTPVAGRTAAVRALILYPMNALVDDQLVRLRRALDSTEAHNWLDQNRNGNRFYFGRYTGATPVTGSRDKKQVDLLRSLMLDASALYDAAMTAGNGREHFVPRLDGGEMFSRWDMIESPPDFLITNYSMLNVMMLRDSESNFFSSTRRWMDEHEDNVFTIVLDEMHSYRGTAGTEVAYLIRNLKKRLGLDVRPQKLRVIAASASLEPDRDKQYLSDFFALPKESFEFLGGSISRLDVGPKNLSDSCEPLQRGTAAPSLNLAAALENAFYDGAKTPEEATPEVRTLAELGSRLFPNEGGEVRSAATMRLLQMAREREGGIRWPKLRAHMFFRNVAGMWACSDPKCSELPIMRPQSVNIGRLHAVPTPRCGCGARVLELLYCQGCGDVMLGGYTTAGAPQQKSLNLSLLSDVPDVSMLPDNASLDRTANNYVVYWPNTRNPELLEKNTTADNGKVGYSFKPVSMNPPAGSIKSTDDLHTGWVFRALALKPKDRSPESVLPFPITCPACGDDWRIRFDAAGVLKATDARTMRSPVRTMRTGFEKVNQVLITELMRQFDDDNRKCIVFADSRQDSAKLASGIALNHYQDSVRSLIFSVLKTYGNSMPGLMHARAFISGEDKSELNKAAAIALQKSEPSVFARLQGVWSGLSDETEDLVLADIAGAPSILELSRRVRVEFLRRGMNPGGPGVDLASAVEAGEGPREVPWTKIYDFTNSSPELQPSLSPSLELLFKKIENALVHNVEESLVSGSGRDFESIGLGWLSTTKSGDASGSSNLLGSVAQSSLRILAEKKRFVGLRYELDQPPAALKKFWSKVSERHHLENDEIQQAVQDIWGDAVRKYLIDPAKVFVRPANADVFRCDKCRRVHMTRGAGLCTRCFQTLPDMAGKVDQSDDYYARRATADEGSFRLNCAELTGQTDRSEAQLRQARFQKVFLGTRDIPIADEVDLLSVTTTMEAGVDIGSLDAVVMGNMPPTRFNYQQRVGRAGRRSSPVAIALTVCRPRSHDEHYFADPRAITSAPTPKPYLTLGSDTIARRTLSAEILRMSFEANATAIAQTDLDATVNTHGRFGRSEDWPSVRNLILEWIRTQETATVEAARALLDRTPLAGRAAVFAKETIEWLTDMVDRVAAEETGHEDLSQRLAESGVLPMFGFPSQVRNLYLKTPENRHPWPPRATIDRDGVLAVSSFAPGSELIKDGWVYRAEGVANFVPSFPRPALVADPLGRGRIIHTCRRCAYLRESSDSTSQEVACPQCSAEPGVAKIVDLRQPAGYFGAQSRPFDGNFSWAPRAMPVRAMVDLSSLSPNSMDSFITYRGPALKYVINDNGGRQFEFVPIADGKKLVERAFLKMPMTEQMSAQTKRVAIGAIQPTDFLFIGPKTSKFANGWRLDLTSEDQQIGGQLDRVEGRRAAWYSYSYLLRKIAALHLDVQPHELIAGLYSTVQHGVPTSYAFIADELENGAGFSTSLGHPENFGKFLDAVEENLVKFDEFSHSSMCKGACYGCLRDYQNMAFHPLLDWRLARDVHRLLSGQPVEIDHDRQRTLLNQWRLANDGEIQEMSAGPVVLTDHPARGSYVILPHHPLEGVTQQCVTERIRRLSIEVAQAYPGYGQVFIDEFSLDRTPAVVLDLIASLAG
ncbi:hypothetical protein TV39_04755 [Arthrobacter sp. SPG23]|nr:hypothetical protein TV39_04755 [Arthrobacter sp. SPG23]